MTAVAVSPKISIPTLGWALSAFFVLSFGLCIALGAIVPNWELHEPWLQFFPGFEWLTVQGILIGLVESVVYAWYIALLFGWLYNTLLSRNG